MQIFNPPPRCCRRFAHLMVKKDVACPETKKDLLRKVKNAISSTAERFSGNVQNVRFPWCEVVTAECLTRDAPRKQLET